MAVSKTTTYWHFVHVLLFCARVTTFYYWVDSDSVGIWESDWHNVPSIILILWLHLIQYWKATVPWIQLISKYKGFDISGKHHRILQTRNKLPIVFTIHVKAIISQWGFPEGNVGYIINKITSTYYNHILYGKIIWRYTIVSKKTITIILCRWFYDET